MKSIKKLSVLFTAVLLFFSLVPVVSQPAYAETTNNGEKWFDSVVDDMETEPVNYSQSMDPYGYGVNVPFTMSPANELVVDGAPVAYDIPSEFYSYDNLNFDVDFTASGISESKKNKTYDFYYVQEPSGSYRVPLNAPQTVSFDPTGSGRKDHMAELGVKMVSDSSHLYLFVYDNDGRSSAPLDMGTIDWMYDNSGIDYYNIKNYYSVTAGDYDGDGKDSLVIYACLDNWKLGLYEVNVTSTTSGISLSKKSSNPSYSLLMLEYCTGSNLNPNYHDVSSWVSGTDASKKLCGQVATGDINGDRIDDLAVLTWHGGKFVGSYTDSDPSAPYVAFKYGAKSGSSSILSGKTCGTIAQQNSNSNDYLYDTIAAPGLAAGDVDGDGHDDIVVAGYLKKIIKDGDPEDVGKQSVDESKTAIMAYQPVQTEDGITLALSSNKFDLATTDLMKKGFYASDACFNHSSVAAVSVNGKGSADYIFVNGLLACAEGQGFSVKDPGSELNSGYDYYNARKDDYSNRWIDSVAVGNFDGNLEGTEEVVYSIGLKTSGKDKWQFDMGEIHSSSSGVFHTDAQQLNYPSANTEGALVTGGNSKLCLTFCSTDNDNDGVVARYVSKGYVYSDPDVMAILQAAPYFDELQDYLVDSNETTYSISESFSLEQGTSNSVSFGAGVTHSLAGTLGGYEVKAGYAMEWSEEFTKGQTTETTYSWHANFDDSVVVYRTPVILYRYEIMNSEGIWDPNDALTIAIPGAASYQVMSVADYNDFVDYYNDYYANKASQAGITSGIPSLEKITDQYLQHEGDPFSYRKTNNAGYKLLQSSPQTFAIGSNSSSWEYSQESSFSSSESTSHGFSFEMTITFGLNIPGFVESTLGGYSSLEYMNGHSTTSTKASGKGVSCTVCNVSRTPLTTKYVDGKYGFNYQMASWNSNLKQTNSSQENVPIYGYVLSGVKANSPVVDDLAIQLVTDSDLDPALKLTWSNPATAQRPVNGYVLYTEDGDGNVTQVATLSASETSCQIKAETAYPMEDEDQYSFAYQNSFTIATLAEAGSSATGIPSEKTALKNSDKNKAKAAIQKANEDKAAAANVESLIDAIPAIDALTVADKDKVTAARAAYDALTDDQKARVSAAALEKLTAAEAKMTAFGSWSGSGTAASPYLITSAQDWNKLADYVAGGGNTEGVYFKLTTNISVTAPVGSTDTDPKFSGIFDGNGKTLNVALNGSSSSWGLAPFGMIQNAEIKNLVVTGSVNGGRHCAGLVGYAYGTNQIANCLVSASIQTSDYGYCGGIIGHGMQSTTTLEGCVFAGSITGNNANVGAFWGWRDGGSSVIINCFECGTYATNVKLNPVGIGNNNVTHDATNTYYTTNPSNESPAQSWTNCGKKALSVSGNGISINFGEKTSYSVSGIDAYAQGIRYDNTFYAGSGDQISMKLPSLVEGMAYTADSGELTGSGRDYTLTLSNDPVVISRTAATTDDTEVAVQAQSVVDAIDGLPQVDTLTIADEEAVKAARKAYNALSDEAKAKVPAETVAALEAAEVKIAELRIDAIPAVDKLTLKDEQKVTAARAAYDALTAQEKEKVTKESLDKLKAAEAKIAELKKSANVKVNKIQITGISKKIAAGKKIALTAKVLPANASNKKVVWSVSNKKLATVSATGVVTIKKKTGGKTLTVTAKAADGSGVKATYKIKIMKGAVKSVKITGAKKTLKAGKSLKLKAVVKASAGANKKIKWTTSNKKWAKVTSSGKVTVLKAGKGKTVKITAKATDGTGKKSVVKIKIA